MAGVAAVAAAVDVAVVAATLAVVVVVWYGALTVADTWEKSLVTSILSAGTFFGALFGGNLADWIGRRLSIIIACAIFSVGVALQVASTEVGLLVGGRIIAGFGVGLVSAIVIM